MSGSRTPGMHWIALALFSLGGCAPAQPPDPRYEPVRSVLEVVAVLRRHIPDDTYRFPPARDFTGRDIYRSSLLRLENLERVHAQALRAGHMDDVIDFSKGRALERLRAFDLAAASYRRAAEREGPLEDAALRSAAFCDALDEAARLAPARDFGPPDHSPATQGQDYLAAHEKRLALLGALREGAQDAHYETIVREELERADIDRARYFAGLRLVTRDGDVRALAELQRLVVRHRESKNAERHLLALADLYAELAVEYVADRPPQGLRFDPPAFQELVDSASHLYQSVANQDGTTEKLEAQRRLESFLAFTLRVDRDRFSR